MSGLLPDELAVPLFNPATPSIPTLQHFFGRLHDLLEDEFQAEADRTSLLASNASWEQLTKQGLSLSNLSPSGTKIGLGGKTLIEMRNAMAYTDEVSLPAHGFKPGDPCRIVIHETVNRAASKAKTRGADVKDEEGIECLVWKVSESMITLAVSSRDASPESNDLELPDRCRIVKTANTATYSRMEKAVQRTMQILKVPLNKLSSDVSANEQPSKSLVSPVIVVSEDEDDSLTRTPPVEPGSTLSIPGASLAVEGLLPAEGVVLEEVSNAVATSTAVAAAASPQIPFKSMRSPHPSIPLLNSLFGISQPTITPLTSSLVFFDPNLNASQKTAVKFALEMDQIACIHGPPGTGKTFTLIEIILQLVKVQKKRVLVCGASNLSVDNILTRLSGVLGKEEVSRVGHPARISSELLTRTLDWQSSHSNQGEIVRDVKKELEDNLSRLAKGRKEKGAVKGKDRRDMYKNIGELRKEYRQREGKVVRNILAGCSVVLATCHTSGSRQLMNEEFDVLIIDEATQAVEPVCLIPALKAKKLILAGDPNQLPPTIISDKKSRKSKKTKKMPNRDMTAIEKITDKLEVVVGSDAAEATADDGVDNECDVKLEAESSSEDDAEGADSLKTPASDVTVPNTELRASRSLERTLFERLERLYGSGIKRMLTTQYRMNMTIASFPSSALYDSRLESSPSVASRLLSSLPAIIDRDSEDVKIDLDCPVIFFDTSGCEMYERAEEGGPVNGRNGDSGGSKLNENEGEIVRSWVEKLIGYGVPPRDIAVIAPYQAQVSHIAGLLKSLHPDLLIGTVDSLQGQEREAVVLTLVRSNIKKEVGFLGEERRLNVAMTRPKRQLTVVGDSATVSNGSKYLKSWMEWLEKNADVRYAGDEI